MDVESSSKALGKGSLSEATVVSSSLFPALPFFPSLIQTSGSHKELLEAALSGAVRSVEGWSQESRKPGSGID